MLQPEQGSGDSAATDTPTSLSRRNLPRATHACQWCRAKKAKCDQRQPCSNCIKHSVQCEYGSRRRNSRNRNLRVQNQAREKTADRQNQLPSPASARTSQDEPPGSETPGPTQGPAHSVYAPQNLPVHHSDVVGDVNQHTHGTEFYGTSSNFVLLNQLFAFAQQHLPPGHASYSGRNETSYLSPSSIGGNEQPSFPGENGLRASDEHVSGPDPAALPQGRISVINLLSNEETLQPPSRPRTPPHTMDKQQNGLRVPLVTSSRARDGIHLNPMQHDSSRLVPQSSQSEHDTSHPPSFAHLDTRERLVPVTPIQIAKRRLEREYVRLFMDNLHYIHPVLDSLAFTTRCEEEIWAIHARVERKKHMRHFLALYNIVVAIGALVAGKSVTQHFEPDIKLCMEQLAQHQNSAQPSPSRALSGYYFRKSRELLGDIFEVCSLESAQTLLFMSLYCQNSHKPHACYMYCGQAVRTALAIGLANDSMPSSAEDRKTARRTWWCIYSHEIDMSCSSGRRDSLGKPRNYQIPLPLIRDQSFSLPDAPEVENSSVAIINEMVHFAAVLRRVSKDLYHDSKGLAFLQKSAVAKELDSLLDDWKARLPEWLNFGKVSFRGEEWAAKQKLVLHLRYLNARILIHRPFLAAPTSGGQLQTSSHVELCLDAARETIRVLYDAYAHRYYFRTWWYNSTYTLYAGMIILYVVMLGHTAVCSNDLLNDVHKAQDILVSMEEATVARRSADLIREGLEVAQTCVQYRQNTAAVSEETRSHRDDEEPQAQMHLNDVTLDAENNIPRTLFSCNGYGPDPGSLLASLIDPNLLQGFTAGANVMPGLDSSVFPFDGFYGDEPDADLMSIL